MPTNTDSYCTININFLLKLHFLLSLKALWRKTVKIYATQYFICAYIHHLFGKDFKIRNKEIYQWPEKTEALCKPL